MGTSPDEVNSGAEVSLLLKSTLILDAGCVATKIGPRHLLLSARCVNAHKEAFAKGKTLPFKTANNAKDGTGTNAVLQESTGSGRRDSGSTADAGSAPSDSGSSTPSDGGSATTDSGTKTDAGTKTDGGSSSSTSEPKEGSSRTATVFETTIHPSWEAKCTGAEDACAFGSIASGDAADVALVVLDLDLEGVETVPVDLDAVGQAESVLVIGSGCDIVGAEQGTGLFTKKTTTVPSKLVGHVGSPYKTEPAKTSSLGQSYVITPGPAWKKNEAKICTSDFGAPVFRAGVAAVAGVTSNFTTFGPDTFSPVTVHHTRLDEGGRYKIGNWLESQGATTIHSCSEMAGGCVKKEYEGGAPVPPSAGPGGGTTQPAEDGSAGPITTGDGGTSDTDGGATEEEEPKPSGPVTGQEEQLADQGPPEESYSDGEDDGDYADAAAPKKKKKTEESGCSAAPGPMPTGTIGLAFGVGLAVMAIGRRRRAK